MGKGFTFSAKILSPTFSVGHIEVEGIDLGSAKKDLNNKLTVTAVKAAFASSEQELNIFEIQLSFVLILKVRVASVSSTTGFFRWLAVPTLSTSTLPDDVAGSLQGSHLDPCKKGMIEEAFNGEIQKTPMLDAEEPEIPAVDFISDTRTIRIGLEEQFPPTKSAAIVL